MSNTEKALASLAGALAILRTQEARALEAFANAVSTPAPVAAQATAPAATATALPGMPGPAATPAAAPATPATPATAAAALPGMPGPGATPAAAPAATAATATALPGMPGPAATPTAAPAAAAAAPTGMTVEQFMMQVGAVHEKAGPKTGVALGELLKKYSPGDPQIPAVAPEHFEPFLVELRTALGV